MTTAFGVQPALGSAAAPNVQAQTTAYRFSVPALLAASLAAAVVAGSATATAWEATHTKGQSANFDAYVKGSFAPPNTSAAAEATDLAGDRAAAATRTAAGNAQATTYANNDGSDLWLAAINDVRTTDGLAQSLLATKLVAQAEQRAGALGDSLKDEYHRPRPFQVDPSIGIVVPSPGNNTSYPSGHALGAYSAALVLAHFLPSESAQLLADAQQIAYSRVYGGVHFPSDVIAGARLASEVATDVLHRSAS